MLGLVTVGSRSFSSEVLRSYEDVKSTHLRAAALSSWNPGNWSDRGEQCTDHGESEDHGNPEGNVLQ